MEYADAVAETSVHLNQRLISFELHCEWGVFNRDWKNSFVRLEII